MSADTLSAGRALIGLTSKPQTIRIEAGQLKFFAKATGQTDPAYFDIDAAKAAGHPNLPAPATFAFSLTLAFVEQAGFGLSKLVDDGRHVLHAAQGFQHYNMLFAEDEVTLTTRITDYHEKKDGALRFIVQRTMLTNQRGEQCVEVETSFAVRRPA